jgi:uncharacterized protein
MRAEPLGLLPVQAVSRPALLALNNAHAVETSFADAARFDAMIEQSWLALATPEADAFLLCFDQHAAYDSLNFRWFQVRFDRFVYVDRIIVAASRRGQGLAGQFYAALFEAARAAGHERIVCEVNSAPPNPASEAFHARLGFAECGRTDLPGLGKSVRYLMKVL